MKPPYGWSYFEYKDKKTVPPNLIKYVAQETVGLGKGTKQINVDIKPCNKEEADFCAWVVNFTEEKGRFPTPKDIEE
jgi:hypothetical protein